VSVSKFYQFELNRLKNESEMISFFTKHPVTIGSYREKLLRDYLFRFTPHNLKIESGFVFDFESAEEDQLYRTQTKQVDCLVFDDNNYVPFLRTMDFAIIEPSALYAGIEIKSQLTFYKEYDNHNNTVSDKYPFKYSSDKPYRWTGTIVNALENIKSVADVARKYKRNFFRGIFAYSSNVNYKDFLFAFDNGELQRQLSIEHLSQLPTYICVLDQSLVYFSRVSLFEDEAKGFDPSQTEMTVIEAVEENIAFPLQFFTNAYKIHIEHSLLRRSPHKRGLFTAGFGQTKIWGHHFDLWSE
jgi:hypothetical protein